MIKNKLKMNQEIKYLKDKYFWRAILIALRLTGLEDKDVARDLGVSRCALSGWAGHSHRRPSNPKKYIEYATPRIGKHMIRVCTKPEYDNEQ